MKTPEERIQIIEQSLGCFWRGLWSFLPFIGIVPAIGALILHRRTRRLAAGNWNPAARYLKWGLILARLNLTITIVLLGVVVFVATFL